MGLLRGVREATRQRQQIATRAERLHGDRRIAFEPTEGSSCDDLVTSDTPLFEAIPCEMVYAFKAPRTGE